MDANTIVLIIGAVFTGLGALIAAVGKILKVYGSKKYPEANKNTKAAKEGDELRSTE